MNKLILTVFMLLPVFCQAKKYDNIIDFVNEQYNRVQENYTINKEDFTDSQKDYTDGYLDALGMIMVIYDEFYIEKNYPTRVADILP